MDEVEDLSSEIKLMREQIKSLSQDKAQLQFKNSRMSIEIEDLREENLDLLDKIKSLNYKVVNTQEQWSLSQDHQGNGLQGCEQFTKNLTYGSLQPHEQEQKQTQLIKMLDLQCENENLKWKLSTQEVDISIMVGQLQKYMK